MIKITIQFTNTDGDGYTEARHLKEEIIESYKNSKINKKENNIRVKILNPEGEEV